MITDAYIKTTVIEICFEKNTKESLTGTKYIYRRRSLLIHKRCISQHIFDKENYSRRHFSGWLLLLELKVYIKKVHLFCRDVKVSCNTGLLFVLVSRPAGYNASSFPCNLRLILYASNS